ncbi:MAG: DUF5615 family PIN-like protein [Bryobacteraceae bacterium]
MKIFPASFQPGLVELFPGSIHAVDAALLTASDTAVWSFAKANGFMIVSADSDFFDMATALGPPPKVIWLRRWTHPTRDVESILRREAIRIRTFDDAPELGVLVLDKA